MKKFISFLVVLATFISCKKEQTTIQAETSDQQLVKITKTSAYGGGVISINYSYNSAGKLIAEGIKTYERDDQQRITRILEPNTMTNRTDTHVYYKDPTSNEVAYTFCTLKDNIGTDSVVYIHNQKGELIKTISYFRDLINGKIFDAPVMSEYILFTHDDAGNLMQWDDYKVQLGYENHCGSFSFNYYDKKINPLYTGDEVRASDIIWGGMLNNSANNCTNAGIASKVYEYRADGRPRSCISHGGEADEYELRFEYK